MTRFIRKVFLKFGLDIIKKTHSLEYINLLTDKRYIEKEITLLNKNFIIPDSVSFYHSYHEIFSQNIYKFNSNNSAPIIIDCGSNCGTSIVYFKNLFPNSIIKGFEADSYIYSVLKKNIDRRNYSNVTINNLAIWKEETELEFFSEGADGGRITNNYNTKTAKKVKTVKLSSILKDVNIVDMLKIDIEGAETEVLIECKDSLDKVKNIFIEYHSFIDYAQTLDIILEILKQNGFRYHIHHQFISTTPFISRKLQLGMDLQLNIFAYK